MVDFLRPSADVSIGAWTNESGGSTLFASLDESAQADADYVQSGPNPANDTFEVALSDPSGRLGDGTVKFSVGKQVNNSVQVDVTVYLVQGTTVIASWPYSDVAFGLSLKTVTLTAPQLAAITDFNDLRMRVTANLTVNFIVLRDGSNVTTRAGDPVVLKS